MGRGRLNGQSGGLPIKENERISALASGEVKRGNFLKIATQTGEPTIPSITTPSLFVNTYGKFDTNTWFSLPNGYKINFWHSVSGSALTATILKINSDGTKTSTDTSVNSGLYLLCVRRLSDYSFILTTSDSTGKGLYVYRIDIDSSTNIITVTSLGSCITTEYMKSAMMLPLSDTKGIIVYGKGANARGYSDNCYLFYVVYAYSGSVMTFSAATQLDYQAGSAYTPFGDYLFYDGGVMFSIFGKYYDATILNDVITVTQKGTAVTSNYSKFIDNFLDGCNIANDQGGIYKCVYDIASKTLVITKVFSCVTPKQFNGNNGVVSVIYSRAYAKTIISDNSAISSLGCNTFLALSNHFVGSGTWPYSPGVFTFYANSDFSVVTSLIASKILVNGQISGPYIAWRDNGYVYFLWNDYKRSGENTRLPYYFVTSITDGSLPTVKRWDGAFDPNTFGIANNSAVNGEPVKVLIPK